MSQPITTRQALSSLRKWSRFIFEHDAVFMAEFAPGYKDAELIGVWYSCDSVKFNSILDSGQHITDCITMSRLLQWIRRRRDNTVIHLMKTQPAIPDNLAPPFGEISTAWRKPRNRKVTKTVHKRKRHEASIR